MLIYLIRHKTVQRKHHPYVWGLQLAQVTQYGHVTQDAAVYSPGKVTATDEGKAARPHSAMQTRYPRRS